MPTDTKRVRAMVRVVLDVEADSVWSGDTTWNQIAGQAEDSVRGLLVGGNELVLKNIPKRIKSLQVVEVRVIPEGKT